MSDVRHLWTRLLTADVIPTVSSRCRVCRGAKSARVPSPS